MTIEDTSSTFKSITNKVLSQDAAQKIIKVAVREEKQDGFPHITESGKYDYIMYPFDWWTSGFFPGSLWVLYERATKYGHPLSSISTEELLHLAESWSHRLEPHKNTTTTHDLGFLIMPSYYREYQLMGSTKAAEVIVATADSLVKRWNEPSQCFMSWDRAKCGNYSFSDPKKYNVVIIDNMMNLNLLYAATEITGEQKYKTLATKHALTTTKLHIRPDWSTYHLCITDSSTGERIIGLTNQGYSHESCWSRGQAWALYGYAEVYKYTGDKQFLTIAKKLADYFLSRLDDDYIVYWDFDAPRPCAWDVSAAMCASSGMLMICQLENSTTYFEHVKKILNRVFEGALAPESGDVILDRSTIANYKYHGGARTDHGLVYADYYFLELGNRLIEMGLVD